MILYYAMGGGLGHLVRARAVAHTLGIESETVLLSSSLAASDPRVVGPLRALTVPAALDRDRAAWRRWLERTLAEMRPAGMLVDTFPAGILGELAEIDLPRGLRLSHVARLLRADVLGEHFDPSGPHFETAYLVEELPPEHLARLAQRARVLTSLALRDPTPESPDDEPTRRLGAEIVSRHAPFWLVVHSGPTEEVGELVRFAADLRAMEKATVDLVVLTQGSAVDVPEGVFCYDLHPATLLFPRARRIISAGGFNVLRQAAPWREIHAVLPLPRRHDDQHLRVARWRKLRGNSADCAAARETGLPQVDTSARGGQDAETQRQ